jgi:hypothetical protein
MVNLARVQKSANETLGSEFKPETYGRYFEDLNLLPKAEIVVRPPGEGAVSGQVLPNPNESRHRMP